MAEQGRRLNFYGEPLPGLAEVEVGGRLIVVEGTDGAGRSTQIRLMKEWLEDRGFAVVDTGLTRSDLAGPGIKRAKLGHTLDPLTLNLFYAADFCDRLEKLIVPSLRAGMVVLADRYIYSMIARAGVRGMPIDWMQDVYSFAPIPDRVIYMDLDVGHLLPRVLRRGSFDYWESGQDFIKGQDPYQSFIEYQTSALRVFADLARQYDFATIDARGPIADTFTAILREVQVAVAGMLSEPET